jgi:hypothetical protein
MFQFPGFASLHYVFMQRYPLPGGLPHSDIHGSTPARGSPWLFAACHVLHRLLVPRHPPNALLILDIPDPFPQGPASGIEPHHAQKPSPVPAYGSRSAIVRDNRDRDHGWLEDSPGNIISHSAPRGSPPGQAGWQWPTQGMHNRILSHGRSAARLRGAAKDPSDKIVHNASEPSPPAGGVAFAAPECFAFKRGTAIPGQTYGRTAHQISGARCHGKRPDQSATPMRRHLLMTRPETHQNLIHLDKEQHGRRSSRSNGATTHPGRYARTRVHTEFGHSAILGSVVSCSLSGFGKNASATGDGKPVVGPARLGRRG